MKHKKDKILNALQLFVLSSMILLTDYYFLHPSLRVPTLAMALLVSYYLLFRSPILFPSRIVWKKIHPDSRRALIAGGLFLSYMTTIDFIRTQDAYAVTVAFCSTLLILLLLPIFEDKATNFPLIHWFRRLMFISICFALLQFVGLHITLGKVIHFEPILGHDQIVSLVDSQFSRTTGATSNTIAFAQQIMLLAMLTFSLGISKLRAKHWAWLAFYCFMLVTSQTRAAIIAMFPSLFLAQVVTSRNLIREIVRIFVIVSMLYIAYFLFTQYTANRFGYITKEVNTGDTYRFWVNWYMSIGVLTESPFFGIAREQAWDLYMRYGDLSMYRYDPTSATPTHHNQLGYYLRYYGLVGVALWCWLYTTVFIKILRAPALFVKIFLSGFILADLIFSMAHNNKLIGTPLIWIFLSLTAKDSVKDKN